MKLYGRIVSALFLLSACSSAPPKSDTQSPAATTPPTELYLSDIRQLTFEGERAGEGYFSRDGRYLTFQSEREKGNPFYQIYVMDMKTGATHRVSTGTGKTTCSWISPDNKKVLFASTHADPKLKEKVKEEYEARKKPKEKYAWSFDDQFEIYETDISGRSPYKNLTHSPGYDAEGSYSPDGKWIAFASNRSGFTTKLNAAEKKLFDKDQSSQMDIYIMRADGSDVKRITNSLGYDGGPFFSPDGTHIVYRHFQPDGRTAEVRTMKLDGSENKEITHLNAMSWAPFYHPSGKYFIFTTNVNGYANFELYIVDVEGRRNPVRVTDLPGFDGLPVFSPDGNSLVWAHTNEKGEPQLYTAKWNDALARKALKLDPIVPDVKQMNTQIDTHDAQTWVEYLASEHLEGRATGGAQEAEYMTTIARAFKDMGLKPYAKDFIQQYEFTSGITLDDKGTNSVQLHLGDTTEHPAVSGDWIPLSYSKNGKFAQAPMVFVGYGIVAPAAAGQPVYDSYAGLDVKDKWVLAFSGLPEEISNDRRFFLHTYSRLQHKAMMARNHGALGLIVVDDTIAPPGPMHLIFEGRNEDAGIPVIRFSPKTADKIFASQGTSRKEWTQKLASGEIQNFPFGKASLEAEVAVVFKKSMAHNAVAILQVPGATSSVIVGAHGDHLGHGQMGNSLWRGQGSSIHYGADDNASGVAGVMEIAADMVRNHRSNLKQNIIFAVWSGEEIGILGSNHFAKNLDKSKISAYLNMDMIGRYRDQLMIQGVASAPEWKSLIEKVSAGLPLVLHTQDDPYLPSDALTFYMHEIPILMAFTGSHSEYHTPKDRPELINYTGLAQTAAWVERMAIALGSSSKALVTYNKVESTKTPNEGRGFRLYLGTVPDYNQDGKTGVVISGTSKDSPAEKAGLKAGDMIVELGGMKIQSLNDYVYCLQALKANQRTVMRVIRRGEEKALDITPVLKIAQ